MCDKIMENINIHQLVREGIRNEKKPWEHEKLNIDELVKEIRIEKLKEDNEDLKCEIAALKQDMEEVQHENSNMRALIQTSLSIHNHAALQDEVEELKEQNKRLRGYNRELERVNGCVSAAHVIEHARRNRILVLNAYEKKHGFDDCDDETWCLFIEYMKGIACAGHLDDTMREWYEEFKMNNNNE